MSLLSKSARIQLWLDRVNRFSAGDGSVADFCAVEGCSLPSFYHWKRRLSPQIRQPRRPTSNRRSDSTTTPAFSELELLSPSSPVASIHLPNGVEIKLGSEASTVRVIVAEVLQHCCGASAQEPARC